MKKTAVTVVTLVICFSAVVWAGNNYTAQENASEQAFGVVPYQSALMGPLDLPGNHIPRFGEVDLPRDEPSFWRLGWAEPIGRDSQESPVGPGRKNNPEKGAGRVSIRLWVDGVEVRLRTVGGVRYATVDMEIGPVTGWLVVKDFWIEFPANYFAMGEHTFTCIIDVSNLEGWPQTLVSTATFN